MILLPRTASRAVSLAAILLAAACSGGCGGDSSFAVGPQLSGSVDGTPVNFVAGGRVIALAGTDTANPQIVQTSISSTATMVSFQITTAVPVDDLLVGVAQPDGTNLGYFQAVVSGISSPYTFSLALPAGMEQGGYTFTLVTLRHTAQSQPAASGAYSQMIDLGAATQAYRSRVR